MKENMDILGRDEAVALSLRELYHAWGYEPYKMSKFEPYDFYARNRSFVTGDNILTFTDTNGRLMALKPDVTLSIVKNYRGGQRKVYYNESVYRDTGASHEFQEILQTGLECIGGVDLYTQTEVLTLAAESLRRISEEYILDIASVAVTSALAAATDAGEEETKQLLGFVREKNAHGIRGLFGAGRLPEEAGRMWEALASFYGPARTLLPELEALCFDEATLAACHQLGELCRVLDENGTAANLDFSIVGGLRYYNGVVFKGYVPGVPAAILSGGRYDDLVRRLGKDAGAIGFAVYLDLLRLLPAEKTAPYDANVLFIYGGEAPAGTVLAKARGLRSQGLTVRVQSDAGGDDGRFGQVIRI